MVYTSINMAVEKAIDFWKEYLDDVEKLALMYECQVINSDYI